MFQRNKCKVNEPQAKLEHRRFYDYDVEALKRNSRFCYGRSSLGVVHKLCLVLTMNEIPGRDVLIVYKFQLI